MKKIWKTVLVVLSIFCLSIIAFGVTKKIGSQYTIDTPMNTLLCLALKNGLNLKMLLPDEKCVRSLMMF